MDDIANTSGQGQQTLTSGSVAPAGAQNAGSQPKGVGGGEVSGILATVANIAEGGYGEREAARKANQYAQDQMILSNQLTTDLQNKAAQHQLNYFNTTAKYNSPEEQVKRLKQAGLNPALAYGSAAGAGGSGQTGSAPGGQTGAVGSQKANAAGAKAANTDAAIGMASLLADIELKKSQARKNTVEADFTEGARTEETEAGIEKVKAEVKTEEARAQIAEFEAAIKQVESRIAQATEYVSIQTAEATLADLITDMALCSAQIEGEYQRQDINEQQREQALSLMKAQTQEALERVITMREQQGLINAQEKVEKTRRMQIFSSIVNQWAETGIHNYQARTGRMGAEQNIKNQERAAGRWGYEQAKFIAPWVLGIKGAMEPMKGKQEIPVEDSDFGRSYGGARYDWQ